MLSWSHESATEQLRHTPSSASQELGTRQETHHLQHHNNWKPDKERLTESSSGLRSVYASTLLFQHHENWEPDKTQTILSSTNSSTRSGSQTVKTQPIFSNTRTWCQTFGYERSSTSVDLRRYFHCSDVALEQLSEQQVNLLLLVVT